MCKLSPWSLESTAHGESRLGRIVRQRLDDRRRRRDSDYITWVRIAGALESGRSPYWARTAAPGRPATATTRRWPVGRDRPRALIRSALSHVPTCLYRPRQLAMAAFHSTSAPRFKVTVPQKTIWNTCFRFLCRRRCWAASAPGHPPQSAIRCKLASGMRHAFRLARALSSEYARNAGTLVKMQTMPAWRGR